jgi:type II secretory pathway pseudopilin PulG
MLTADRGFTIAELVVGMMVLFVAIFALVGALGLGIRLVGSSKQRQAATAAAQSEIEEIRRLDYSVVALASYPAPSSDPSNPDSGVNGHFYNVPADGTSCSAPSGSTCEEIVQDPNGLVTHTSTESIGTTQVTTYVYVTWVDDTTIPGAQNYKRIVIYAKWSGAAVGGIANWVRMQTFVGTGNVVLPTLTPAPSATPVPSGSPSPSPSPVPGACGGDTTAPSGSLSVLSGAGALTGYTNSTQVTVVLRATDTCAPLSGELSNDGTTFGSPIGLSSGVSVQTSWTIPAGDGTKTVYARYKDGVPNTSLPVSASIVLDRTVPSSPANNRKVSCGISGSTRSATLTWDAAGDTNLQGYRVYRSDNGGSYVLRQTVSGQTASDISSKTDNVSYVIRAYDKAGNESANSNVRTFTKNSCA